MKRRRVTDLKKKIILLLSAGVALGTAKTMSKQFDILKEVSKEWRLIDRTSLHKSLISLYDSKVISLRPKGDTYEIILSGEGKRLAARFNLENLKIKKQEKWDDLWRFVMFDIPEKRKKGREALRFHLKEMGMLEYQKSIFICPYPCEKEVKFVTEFFLLRSYVKFIIAKAVSDEEKFRRKFNL